MRAAPAPVFPWYDLLAELTRRRDDGRTQCLAFGAFDTLAAGDVQFLEWASSLADLLIVLVDPVPSALWRTACIAGLRWPDLVGIHEDDLASAVAAIAPDVLVHRHELHPSVRQAAARCAGRTARWPVELPSRRAA